MRRPYIPHPGPLPSAEQARRRWIRPTGIYGRTSGEEPYHSFVDRARAGLAPFEYPVDAVAGESHAQLVDRLMRSGELKKQAAHAVALGLQGFEHRREGRKAVHAAEVLAHHEMARFQKDPTPIRGDLDACVSPAAFGSISPSIAVNLSALRSLRWSSNLRPRDLLFLWILIGCASAGRHLPSVSVLKKAFGISRPHESLRRIDRATFSLMNDPDIAPEKWISNCPVLAENRLVEMIKPRAGGENYAYIELRTLAALTALWQEKALRGIMAAAVRARIYWSKGGIVRWHLSRQEVLELFSLPATSNWNRLRRERLQPFSRILESMQNLTLGAPYSIGSRFRMKYSTVRNEDHQGRPAGGIELEIRVIGAPESETPNRGLARNRTEDRASRQPIEVELSGLGTALSDEEKRRRRSAAAREGWKKRRSALPRPAEQAPPRRPTTDEMEIAEALAFLTETPSEAFDWLGKDKTSSITAEQDEQALGQFSPDIDDRDEEIDRLDVWVEPEH